MHNQRAFFADLGMGFTGLALGAMLHRDGFASECASGLRPTVSRILPPRPRA